LRAAAAFGLVALAAGTAGSVFYLLARSPAPTEAVPVQVAPAALYAATFHDAEGRSQSIGRYAGRPLVLNFWATWCAPCREEMPAFEQLQRRWAPRIQFVGLAQEDPAKVRDFAARLGVTYPLWTGGDEVMELSARLGNQARVLPYTVLVAPDGRVLEQKVGAYNEQTLEAALRRIAQ
jgi:thiol-disulfide isomerase/thioredoxin